MPLPLTRQQLADLFEVSTRTISAWQGEAAFPRPVRDGRANVYDGAAVLRWQWDRELSRLVATDDGDLLDPLQERAKLDLARRVRVELDTCARRGELVDAGEVTRQFATASRRVRDSLLTIPDRIASVVAAESDADRVHRLMLKEIEQTLTALADSKGEATASE